ncbi:beta-N-acetylhexosaminidase [Herbiconiux ginsengi]|uniref:Beta-N-acetylhexosaminidase n=1 Tax=Herbiconiux ginsengi TaxID=381665 RepID=A0A1H3JS13_9MICO|nr:beta-N-acetylhexosaminidase [Herbiconiux ginsengi]SDY42681.1 beta-N-acetylhexosaminidase [Herbiconiux ginsengi]
MSRQHILGTLLPGFVGTTLPEWVERMLREGLGGVCLFGENIVSTSQLRALTDAIRAANPDALIAIDEEGGDVTRLYYDRGSPFPGNAVLGRLDDLDATRSVASAVGAELRAVGVNLDFAPDVDINSNPRNPVIGIRSFGSDPALVARHSAAWVEGLQAQGVAASIKHFPGHGDTAQDSHLALPSVNASIETLRERELLPFAAAVRAGAFTVMTSHIVLPRLDPAQPATFSAAVLEGVLRGELGFDGVIVSDALDMVGASGEIGIPAAAVRALAAGCDLLCIGTKNTEQQIDDIVDRVSSALVDGELTVARLAEATVRLRQLGDRIRDAEVRAGGVPGATPGAATPDAALVAAMPDARRVVSSFALDPAAAETLRGAGWVVVRVDTVANIAVGAVPWGPFRALAEAGMVLPVVEVTEEDGDDRIGDMPLEASVLVIGKDNERRPRVTDLIDALRARHERVVVVDMGWPGDDPRYAGVATFGASALVGDALAALLIENGVRP